MTRPYHTSRPAPLTPAERMERKRKAKEAAAGRRLLAAGQKQKTLAGSQLRYDYGQVEEQHRERVQMAALEIRRWQRNTIEIGRTLLAVKAMLPHGQFEDWWNQEFGLGERMVQSLLTVARVYGDPANPRRVAGLSDGALYLLAAPSTPEEARAEVERLLIEGNAPGRAQVKAIINAHKPPREPKPQQLTGPVAESEPDEPGDAIAAEYEIAPVAAATRSPQEIAAELSLSECLMVLDLAKEAAKRARELAPATHNIVTDMLPSISRLIHKIEQELRK